MGFMGSLLGTVDGNNGGAGMRYSATQADLVSPFTQQGITDANAASQNAVDQQMAFANALAGGAGSGMAMQGQLGQMLLNQANGQGPNPAQAQFQNNANQLAAQQAGAVASIRGINPALQARLALQQTAGAQQNMAGQAAALQAQQQIAAQGALGNLAAQQIGQQQGALQGYSQSALGQQQNVLNSVANFNSAKQGSQASVNTANSGVAQVTAKNQADFLGGMMNGAGAAMGMAEGGIVPAHDPVTGNQGGQGPAAAKDASDLEKGSARMGAGIAKALGAGAGGMASGGVVPANGPASGFARHVQNFKGGGVVPGKANVQGDSPKNDTVPAMLSPEEIVLPRSVTKAKDAPEKAAAFVAALLAKKRGGQ